MPDKATKKQIDYIFEWMKDTEMESSIVKRGLVQTGSVHNPVTAVPRIRWQKHKKLITQQRWSVRSLQDESLRSEFTTITDKSQGGTAKCLNNAVQK